MERIEIVFQTVGEQSADSRLTQETPTDLVWGRECSLIDDLEARVPQRAKFADEVAVRQFERDVLRQVPRIKRF